MNGKDFRKIAGQAVDRIGKFLDERPGGALIRVKVASTGEEVVIGVVTEKPEGTETGEAIKI